MAGPWERYQTTQGPWSKYATPELDLTMNPAEGVNTLAAGIGAGMASGIRALGGGALLERFGMPGTKEEAEAQDKALDATTGGKVGRVVGIGALAAPTALVPGANTYAGAAALGALTGGALTEGDVGDRALGAVGGAAGGAAGLAIGRGVGNAANWMLDKRMQAQAARDAVTSAARTANEAGYVLPPNEINRNLRNSLVNAWGGQIKTAQESAFRNQQNTNRLASQAVGLEDSPVTREALEQVRKNANVVYGELQQLGTLQADKSYFRAIDSLKGIYEGAAKDFPELAKPEITNVLNSIRKDQFSAKGAIDAIRILRADSDAAFKRGDKGLAKALKGGANALEDVIERNIEMRGAAIYEPAEQAVRQQFGTNAIPERFPGTALTTEVRQPDNVLREVQAAQPSDLLQRFREARQLIAKTYDLESALKGDNIDASVLARKAQKNPGRMTGEMKTIAETAQRFPKATQLLKEAPHPYSMVDVGLGGVAGYLDPMLIGLSAARPVVRMGALSPQGQRIAAMNMPSPVNGLLDAARNPHLLQFGMPLGASAGLLSLPTKQ